jgi:hypothetical protein
MALNGTGWYFGSAGRDGGTGGGAGQTGHGEGGGCSVPQAARHRITQRTGADERTMWVVYLEMGMALALAILIVWWTWPAKRKPGDKDKGGPDGAM